MKKICTSLLIALLAMMVITGTSAAFKSRSAGSTDMRGKGIVLVDSIRTAGPLKAAKITATDSASSPLITATTFAVKTPDGANFPTITSANDTRISVGFLGITSSVSYGAGGAAGIMQPVGGSSLQYVPGTGGGFGIGNGLFITQYDTSAAGDSTKIGFVNGNKIMHFGTEVKAP